MIYEWDQTLEEVNCYVKVPPGVPAKMLHVAITTSNVKIGIKGNPPYLDHDVVHAVKTEDCFWTLDDGELHIQLQKVHKGRAWGGVFVGHEALNPMAGQDETQRLMLERFQEENPGFDFSGASFNGQAPDPSTFMGGVKY